MLSVLITHNNTKHPMKGQRETSKGDVYVYYLDSGDGNTSICYLCNTSIYSNLQNWIH